jgi:predicted nucleic acid-binding protein
VVLIDTTALYGIINSRDQFHQRARRHLRELRANEQIYVPRITMIEMIGHLTRLHGNRELCLRQRLEGLGSLHQLGWPVVDHEHADFEIAERWWREYADWPIDYPDALIIATACRMNASDIWTFDSGLTKLLDKVAPEIKSVGSGFSEWN